MRAGQTDSGERTRPRVLCSAPPPNTIQRDTADHLVAAKNRRRGGRQWHARSAPDGHFVPSPEFRVRALRTFVIASALVAGVWLCLPKPPLLDGIPFSQCVRD